MGVDQALRILVVDDEVDLSRMLQVHLETEGYQVLITDNGHAALATFSKDHFDLLIVDIKMPDMNGLDLVRAAREMDHSTVIIVMTAYATVETVVEALRLGADDFLVKPFRVNFGLLPMVERCLARRARDQAQSSATEAAPLRGSST
jgi:DNA-binding response OmpR family regulator